MPAAFQTHEVTNQSPAFEDVDLLAMDLALVDAIGREGAGRLDVEALCAYARTCGSAAAQDLARLANQNAPRLAAFDAQGRRRDVVEFHPAYDQLMRLGVGEGLAAGAWEMLARRYPMDGDAAWAGAGQAPTTVARAARLYLAAQLEPGHCHPLIMTNAAAPALALAPELAEAWGARIVTRAYDSRFVPAPQKSGVTLGIATAETQGGTDVAATATRAEPTGHPATGEHVLFGHKWFLSAPMSDAFLMLGRAPEGVTCFLVPRFLPDGTTNAIHLQRLKEKLGNRANGSAEAELAGARGWLVGEAGRGVAAIAATRAAIWLDCAVSSAGLMRMALAVAVQHVRHREVSGARLATYPLMAEVLADLALDAEAAVALSLRVARAVDDAGESEAAAAWARLMTPVARYWVCKIAPGFVAEAMECVGGNGFVEESRMARLYREAPGNGIWEGGGNVMALDVLRILQREPGVMERVLDDLSGMAHGDAHLMAGLERIEAMLGDPRMLDRRARQLVETLAVVAAGAVLKGGAPSFVADAFIASRISGLARASYGQGIDGADTRAILARALPE